MDSNSMHLGGNIVLIGFNSLDKIKLFVLKKMVGSHARRISDKNKFEKLSLKADINHELFSISAELLQGSIKKSESTDKNIFIAVDNALKGLDS